MSAKNSIKFKACDIGFSVGDSWISKAIAYFQKSGWSHCFMVYDVSEREVYTVETSNFELDISRLSNYFNGKYSVEIYRVELTDAENKAILERSIKFHGQTYGYIQLITHMIRILLKKIGIRIKNITGKGITCTENLAYALGMERPEQEDLDTLYDYVRVRGKLIYKEVAK